VEGRVEKMSKDENMLIEGATNMSVDCTDAFNTTEVTEQ